MRRHRLMLPMAFAAGVAAGCTPHVNHVAADPGRLVGKTSSRLGCTYLLHDVVDARPSGDRIGGLGNNMFVLDDAAGLVRRQLIDAGMSAAASGSVPGAPGVTLRILQLYLSQNTMTKVPVVVYEVDVQGQTPFRVRSQLASMNWNGSQNEAYAAYARSMSDAIDQVVSHLNASCAAAR